MDKDKLRMVQSRGGKAAHAMGKAHTWTRKEACREKRRESVNWTQIAKDLS